MLLMTSDCFEFCNLITNRCDLANVVKKEKGLLDVLFRKMKFPANKALEAFGERAKS